MDSSKRNRPILILLADWTGGSVEPGTASLQFLSGKEKK